MNISEGETVVKGAILEMKEECSLVIYSENLKHIGEIDFEFIGNPIHSLVHVFEARVFSAKDKPSINFI